MIFEKKEKHFAQNKQFRPRFFVQIDNDVKHKNKDRQLCSVETLELKEKLMNKCTQHDFDIS